MNRHLFSKSGRAIALIVTIGALMALSTDSLAQERGSKAAPKSKYLPPTLADVGDTTEVAVINTTKGEIVLEFYPSLAPIHVANFKKLTRAGYYDGTTFHRVVPGFVIQGGDINSKDNDPTNDGQGGPGYTIKAEFNSTPHVKGILSMARTPDPNSAGSQFFICLGRASNLDNQYTVFGKVIKGLDVVDAIGAVERNPANPEHQKMTPVKMTSVKLVKRSALAGLEAAPAEKPKAEKPKAEKPKSAKPKVSLENKGN